VKRDRAPTLSDRAAGMLAGVAVGDAMGMPTEFLTPEQIRSWYGHVGGLTVAHPDHPHHRLPAGSVTDDTDHTMLLAELLLERGGVDPSAWAESLLQWAATDRVRENRFVGPATLKTLEALRAGTALADLPRNGTSVGAAMRTAPLAIAFASRERLEREVVASCAVSHFTRGAISGAMAMAFALAAALGDEPTLSDLAIAAKDGAVKGREHGAWTWTAPIEDRIDHALRWVDELPQEETLHRLYVLMGVDLMPEQLVPNAIAIAALADGDPMRAIDLAIHLGGDTDTLASMAGSLCGALNGIQAFDAGVVDQVQRLNGLDLRATADRLLALRSGSARPSEKAPA
jgi:ADP-ribosylglycohydrolase